MTYAGAAALARRVLPAAQRWAAKAGLLEKEFLQACGLIIACVTPAALIAVAALYMTGGLT